MRYMPMVAILTLLLIATPSINLAHSSLQEEISIQNTGNILTETILFEYGAESGNLQPWDVAGFTYGYDPNAYVTVVPDSPLGHTVQVRTGTKSVELYQPAPPKSEFSIGFVYYDTEQTELYFSRWIYLPNAEPWNLNESLKDERYSFGGLVSEFGPADNKNKYFTGLNIARTSYTVPSSNKFWIELRWGKTSPEYDDYLSPEEDFSEFYTTGLKIADYVGVWIHIQMAYKWAKDYTGYARVWLNKEGEASTLIFERTGLKTHPEGYSQWATKAGYYASGFATPTLMFGLFKSIDQPEAWIFIDDIVLATEKVPESYRVVGK